MTPLRRAVIAVAAPTAVAVMRLLWSTYRVTVRGLERGGRVNDTGEPVILVTWHDSVFALGWLFHRLSRRGIRLTYVVSPSVDGELAVRAASLLGQHTVRGSATRSGVKVLSALHKVITGRGGSPVFLSDGPQGPPHRCKLGAVILSRFSGAAMVPVACVSRHALRLPSWDRHIVPLPFTRVTIAVGEPRHVPREAGDEQMEAERAALEEALVRLGEDAARLAGGRTGAAAP